MESLSEAICANRELDKGAGIGGGGDGFGNLFTNRAKGLFVLPCEIVLVVCHEWLSGMVWKLYYGM